MNARIRVDEGEDVAPRDTAASVSHRRYDAFLDGDDATAALASDHGRAVGGDVVGKNDLDHIGTSPVALAGEVDRVQEHRKVHLFVIGGDHEG